MNSPRNTTTTKRNNKFYNADDFHKLEVCENQRREVIEGLLLSNNLCLKYIKACKASMEKQIDTLLISFYFR